MATGSSVTSSFAELASSLGVSAEDPSSSDSSGLYGIPTGMADVPVIWDQTSAVPGYTPPRGRTAGDEDFVADRPAGQVTYTLEESLAQLYQMDPRERLPQLQQLLYAGGFYGSGYYNQSNPNAVQFGVADEDTYAAWRTALVRAARSGKSIWEVLGDAAKGRQGGGAEGPQRAPLVLRQTSPEDLRRLVDRVAREVAGTSLSSDEIDRFITDYQADERAVQQAAYGAVETGGTVVEPASPETAAEDFVRGSRPQEASGRDVLGVLDGAMSFILGGPLGGR